MKKILLIISLFILSGCSLFEEDNSGSHFDIYNENIDKDVFSNRDTNEEIYYEQTNIELNSNEIYEINKEGSYIFSGDVIETQIYVITEDKVQIIFNNLTIQNDNLACLYVKNADKVFVQLVGDNFLSSSVADSQDDNVNGTIFSRDDLTFNGNGTLTLYSNFNGIVSKDDLTFTNGTYNIICDFDAIEVNDTLAIQNSTFNIETNGGYQGSKTTSSTKGLKSDDFIYIKSGTFYINSYDDAIHSGSNIIIDDGNFEIYTNDDAVKAEYSLAINNGTLDINYCYEGLEAQRVYVNGGAVNINSYDDGVNATKSDIDDKNGCYININGGTLIVTIINISSSPEADGFDSNGDILITGGYILIHGTTNTKDTPLDYDGSAFITGGTFLTTGSYSATQQTFNTDYTTQGVIAYELSTSSYYTSDITLKNSNNEIIVSYTPINKYQIIHISHKDIIKDETYTLYIGTTSYSIKMSTLLYSNLSSSSMGGPNRR